MKANNKAYDWNKTRQLTKFKRNMSVDLTLLHLAKIVESFGQRGIHVEELDELKDALQIAINPEIPVFVIDTFKRLHCKS